MELLYISLEFQHIVQNSGSVFASQNGLWHANFFSFLNYQNDVKIMENLTPISDVVNKLNVYDGMNHIEIIEPTFDSTTMSVVIKGTREFINFSRNLILKLYTKLSCKSVPLTKTQALEISKNGDFLSRLNQLSIVYKSEVLVGPENLMIFGGLDYVTPLESEIRVLIDSMINGFFIDCVDVNISVLPLIGGPGLLNFVEIAKQLNSNVYLPDMLPDLYNSNINKSQDLFKIWISGSKSGEVMVTKKLLTNLTSNLSPKYFTKKVTVSKDKLDLLVLHHQPEVLKIMLENSTFVQLPKLGDSSNEVIVQSHFESNVHETIKDIYHLTSGYYKLLINSDDTRRYQQLVELVVQKFQMTVKINGDGVELVGKREQVKNFLKIINSNGYNMKIQLMIEINNEQKDFISGKKNGKVMKILNQIEAAAIVKFLPLNEYNFIVDYVIENTMNLNALLKAMELIENELPAELKFNVPEMFHKSIIGNGGMIIQSIMKKYNVFIKFSSQNKDASSGNNYYGFKRLNNVLIKCPMKNSKNIQLVKNEIDNLVDNCCKNNLNNNYLNKNANNSIYCTVNFELLKAHYNLLINNFKLNNLNNLEIEYQSFIQWPDYNEFVANSLTIPIVGSDIKLKFFINHLINALPQNFKLTVNKLISSKAVDQVATTLKMDNIEMTVHKEEIWLSYYDASKLTKATSLVTEALQSEGIVVIDQTPFEYQPISVDLNQLQFESDKKERRKTKPLHKITNEV